MEYIKVHIKGKPVGIKRNNIEYYKDYEIFLDNGRTFYVDETFDSINKEINN